VIATIESLTPGKPRIIEQLKEKTPQPGTARPGVIQEYI